MMVLRAACMPAAVTPSGPSWASPSAPARDHCSTLRASREVMVARSKATPTACPTEYCLSGMGTGTSVGRR